MAARSSLAEGKGRQVAAGGNVVQRPRDGCIRPGGGDRGRGGDVHEIDHRDRSVCLGKERGDRRKGPRSET
jgi:hypothetical protein